MELNGSKFADAVGVSRQAISKAVKNGLIQKTGKLFDTDNPVNANWINLDPKRVISFRKYCGTSETVVSKPVKRSPKQASVEENEFDDGGDLAENIDRLIEEYDPVAVGQQKSMADTRYAQGKVVKIEFENQVQRNKLANREILTDVIELLFNEFITGIPRTSSTSLTDVGKLILAEGEIKNGHYKVNEDSWMEMFGEIKIKVEKYLEVLDK